MRSRHDVVLLLNIVNMFLHRGMAQRHLLASLAACRLRLSWWGKPVAARPGLRGLSIVGRTDGMKDGSACSMGVNRQAR